MRFDEMMMKMYNGVNREVRNVIHELVNVQ